MAPAPAFAAQARRLLPALAILGVGAVLFSGTLQRPFTGDDVYVTVHNPHAFQLAKIPTYFASDFDFPLPEGVPGQPDQQSRFGLYRPVLLISYAVDHRISGLEPFGWRLDNLLLHLVASLLVLGLAAHLLGSRLAGLVAGLLFVAHPVHTEAVATLVGGRAELLATLFTLASWWLFLAGDGHEGKRRWALDAASAILFLLGLLSKENAVVLPAVLVLCGWTLRGQPAGRLLVRILPHLLLFALYGLVRLTIIGRVAAADYSAAFGGTDGFGILLAIMAILASYLRLVLVPWPLQSQYCYSDLPGTISGLQGALAGLLVLGLIGFAAWSAIRGRHRARPSAWAFGLLLFYLCLVPVSHLIPHWVVMAERFLYLPSVALCLVAGWLATRAGELRRWMPLAFGLPLLAACAWGTVARNAIWADPDRFWTETAECAPGAFEPHDAMGTLRLRQGRLAEAIPYFERAAALATADSHPHYNLGVTLQRLGRGSEAEQAYLRALAITPRHPMASLNLGILLQARGDRPGAKRLYLQSARTDPTHPAPFVNLGAILEQEGQHREAERLFRQALQIAPTSAEARFNLARLLGRTGRGAEAERLYLELGEADPGHAMVHNNLGNLLKDRGQLDQAESRYRAALEVDPGCAPAHYNLANLMLGWGDSGGAAEHFARALALRPDKLEALIGLAHARLQLGQRALAERAAIRAAELAPGDGRVRKLLEALGRTPR